MNIVNLVGHIATDVTVKETKSHHLVCNFNMAVYDYKDTSFIPVTVWNKRAENLEKYCKKGSKIAVSGYLKQDDYQHGEGITYKHMIVIANNIEYLSPKEKFENIDEINI